ncbi:winged helix-turn-helix domain-containing protein [Halioxenophilus aromaticivorans]|uniref:OmpR/PhoB-type domain-containing protein n=1 Tax=Halioxenophilus aromaticivorans TaxID=1306992 RepID=A0AAV3TYV5_9ALTE
MADIPLSSGSLLGRFAVTARAAVVVITLCLMIILGLVVSYWQPTGSALAPNIDQLLQQRAKALLQQWQIDESQVRLQLASDPMIHSMAVMTPAGELLYPQAGTINHTSEQPVLDDYPRLRQLAVRLVSAQAIWERRDYNANELYTCYRVEPVVCLLVSSKQLANSFDLQPQQLSAVIGIYATSQTTARHRPFVTDMAMGLLFMGLLLMGGYAVVCYARGDKSVGIRAVSLALATDTSTITETITGTATATVNSTTDGSFAMADMIVQPALKLAQRGDTNCALSNRDILLLTYLRHRPNQVISKDELYDAAWGREFLPSSRALEQHIINLRRKLDPSKSLPTIIETVHGQGYRYPVL